MPKVLQIEKSRKNALLTVAMVSALAMAQWLLASESVPAAPAPGTIIVAQAPPPKCGQDPQHPCPKEAPKAPAPQPAAPQPKQQVQPQQQAPVQPQLRQQAQPQPTPPPPPQIHQQAQPQPAPAPQPGPTQLQLKQQAQPKDKDRERPVVVQPVPTNTPPAAVITPKGPPPAAVVTPSTPPAAVVTPKGPPPAAVVTPSTPPAAVVTPKGPPPAVVVTPSTPPAAVVTPKGPPPAAVVTPSTPPAALVAPKGPPSAAGVTTNPPAQTFQRVRPLPGQPGWVAPVQQSQGGAGRPAPVAVAPSFANVQDLRAQRHERTEAGGRVVIEEPDHRQIVREGGQAFVRHDENERLFQFGEGRRERRGDGMYSIIERPDGDEIITITDDDGRLIRRFRRERDGREFILIDNRRPRGDAIFLNLPVPIIGIPQDQYIVDTAVAPEPFIYQTLAAPPLVAIERPYSLDEIRYNAALRDRMRRIDVDSINFDFGSWEVAPDQVVRLQLVAQAIRDALARNPNEVFLIEGHTDAVGSDVDNLSLSDRRAETVAGILTESFQIPPENLTSQGYGSHYLKIPTPEANRQNRRVTVRRITPLLNGGNG